jgi:predicted kinase
MKSNVYIFRGAPASGKGTITPEFARTLALPTACLEQDTFRWGFHLIGRDVTDVTELEHALAFRNLLHVYEEYLKTGGYNIVVEGLFTWDDEDSSQGNVKRLIELAKKYDYGVTSIVLIADHDELVRRNAKRTYVVPSQEFETLYMNVYGQIDPSEIQIDSTELSTEETLQHIQRALQIK